MIRMFARALVNRSVAAGSDQVVLGVPLPSGSVVHDVRCDITLLQKVALAIDKVAMYACEAWIIPVTDPDTIITYDVLWDRFVPKDTDVDILDLDTGATDATPFYEPGEPDWSQLFDVGLRPERLYHKNRLLTMANGSIMSFHDTQTPFDPLWHPGDSFTIRVKKRYVVRQPSYLLIGIANPSLDDTQVPMGSTLVEEKWGQMKYVGHVLERALLHVLGVVEAGAETPWEEATALLKEILEPDVREETAATFVSAAWDVTAKSIVDLSVEGVLGQVALTTGR